MSKNPNMLMWALSAKQHLLNVYIGAGPTCGFEAAQRMTREIGDVLTEMHGREKAAVIIYGVADAIAVKGELPKLPVIETVAPPSAPIPAPTKQGWVPRGRDWLLLGILIGLGLSPLFRAWGLSP